MNDTMSQDEIDNILNQLTGTPGGGSSSGGGDMDLSFAGGDSGKGPSLPVGNGNGKPAAKKESSVDTENIPLLLDVKMRLSVVIGNSRRPIREVLDLGKGSVVELDRFVGDDVDVYINDQIVGKGQIVAIDDEYGVKITRILNPVKKPSFKR